MATLDTCDVCGKPLVRCMNCGAIGGGPCECGPDGQLIEPDEVTQSVQLYRQTHESPAEGESRHVHHACEEDPWPEVDRVINRRRRYGRNR